MRFSRRALVILTTLASLIGANLLISTPAQAATSCSGTVTHRQSFSYPGEGVIGELTIYYNSSNGGTNSACFYHRGQSYGVAANTYVAIYRCSQTSGEGNECHNVTAGTPDEGRYASYAGPVGVTGTANYCVGAIGWIEWHGTNIGVFTPFTRGC
ncbi:hypothetical protein OG830_21250 [Streptomyces sp. NBC_00121]|uniref:hypothetical protein n=1 Tax=unclassified Streptomyces TaxID=2593676 RepID=UPI0028C39D7D|nr:MULTISPECIES: hypothetical protein [unclassified Streptomyces]WNO66223.1 hypothetical protein RPQ02_21680 [Streptomyces sp. AM2-3-1]WSC70757.1 hypothetical protein OG807_21160 [Streptomyces sp. NBC_01760]WTI88649.1 hypothetical protein OHB17_21915 [Streptomyces sp. NBC_00724]